MTSKNIITDFCSLDRIEAATESINGNIVGYFKGHTLISHFQPIFSIAHRRPVGYEALLRAKTPAGVNVSPQDIFNLPVCEQETIYLDRLCRNLHLRNFLFMPNDDIWLFLNINPLVMVKGALYGPYFSELLSRYQVPAHRIVVEILEGDIQDESLLADAASYYKSLGCLVALDDFGAGHSNFDRIWRLSPQIVKLDRSIIVQAANNYYARRVLPNLINLIHESGSLSLMEGVETEQEALIAMDSGIDFVQGYYFGKPSNLTLSRDLGAAPLPQLCLKFRHFAENEARKYHNKLQNYITIFQNSAELITSGIAPEEACEAFLVHQETRRCYLLNHDGIQLGINITSPLHNKSKDDPRFRPIADTKDANWSRRHYFRRAMSNPGEVQVSRPYLSITGANLCVTLSIKINSGLNTQIFCCDLDWNEDAVSS